MILISTMSANIIWTESGQYLVQENYFHFPSGEQAKKFSKISTLFLMRLITPTGILFFYDG